MGLVCRFGGVGHVVGCPEDPAARDGSRGQPGARLTVLARNEQLCHVQCEGDHAGEDQQPTGRPQHHYGGTGERQVACTKQKSEDRKIDCRRDKRRNPDRYTEPKSEMRTLPKPKRNVSPTTVPMITVTVRTIVTGLDALRKLFTTGAWLPPAPHTR